MSVNKTESDYNIFNSTFGNYSFDLIDDAQFRFFLDPNFKTHYINQFNKTIVRVIINKKTYFLDTTNKFNPFGQLTPSRDIGNGLLMQEEIAKIM